LFSYTFAPFHYALSGGNTNPIRKQSLRAAQTEASPNSKGDNLAVSPFYFYPYTTGFCRPGNIPTTYALKASFQIFGRGMRTRFTLVERELIEPKLHQK
jgi:hypothetical protein